MSSPKSKIDPHQDEPISIPKECITITDLILLHRDIFKICIFEDDIGPLLRGEKTAVTLQSITPSSGDLIHFEILDPHHEYRTEISDTLRLEIYRRIWKVTYSKPQEKLICFKPIPLCTYYSSNDSDNPHERKDPCITFPTISPPWLP